MSDNTASLSDGGPKVRMPGWLDWLLGESGLMAGRERKLLLLVCGLAYLAQSLIVWGWPALDGFPAIERWLDPAFLRADFYTNTTEGFGVDTWQAVLFGSIQRWTGMHYTVQLALLAVLRHLFWPLVLYRFFHAVTKDETAALAGVVLGVLADFALPKTLGWSWVWGDGCPAMMAVFTMTLAWTEMLKHRAWLGFILLGAATIMQPLVGVHGGIMAGAIFLFAYSAQEKLGALKSPLNYAGVLIFLAIFLWQYLALSPPAAERMPLTDYVHTLVYERHPGDFLVSRTSLRDWLAFALGTGGIAIMAAQIWPRLAGRTFVAGALAIYALICVAGYVFVEIMPVRLVVDLIPFRTVSMGAPLLLLIAGAHCAMMMRAGRWLVVAMIVAAFVLAGPYASHFGFPLAGASALLLLAAVVGATGVKGESAVDHGARIAPVWRLAIVALIVMAIPIGLARAEFMRIPDQSNQHPVYGWAAKNTPVEARFLVEQNSSDGRYGAAISPQLMRLVGRRAVVASRDYPFRDTAASYWLRTWVVALDHGRADRVEKASAQALAAICQTLPYDYVVRRHPLPEGILPEVKAFGPAKGIDRLHVYKVCG